MDNHYFERLELYFTLLDIVKNMKLKVLTKKAVNNLCKIEDNLNKLIGAERIV